MITQLHEMFFCYTGDVKVGEETKNIIRGVAYNSIERFYVDEKGVLNLVLMSLTEGYRPAEIQEGNKMVIKPIKVPVNVLVQVEKAEDIEKFLAAVQAV